MKLSGKTFLYSIGISTMLVGMIVIYFVAMLPSLYVDYMKKQYLESVVEVEKGYMENRSYAGLKVQNPTGSATLEIPFEGNRFYLAGKAFKLTVTVRDDKVMQLLEQLRACFQETESMGWDDFQKVDWSLLKDAVTENGMLNAESPFDLEIDVDEESAALENKGYGKIHLTGHDIVVFEGNAADSDNEYTTYIAIGKTEDAAIFSFLPVMTPQMKEIKTIVLGSVPMIAAVLFLIVLICSRYFSGKIVNPVIWLANYAEEVKNAGNLEISPLKVTGKDEIGDLGRILNELYGKLRENYEELEEKNVRLEKENKRQEIFLRASSHQLKTPVTAALLLVEGMMQEVGKYKDTRKYLPQVKEQLLSMRKMAEDILYLDHCADNLRTEPVDIKLLTGEIIKAYEIQMREKHIRYFTDGAGIIIETDRELMKKILDNLLSNAVSYTEEGGEIRTDIREDAICITNYKAHIEEELLSHIYEPFVSGNGRQRGKGLGLYIAAYYSEVLECSLRIENTRDGVMAAVKIPKSHIRSSQELHTREIE